MKSDRDYADFMRLDKLDLANIRFVVITGISGSGKTTAMHYLFDRFPEIAGAGAEWVMGEDISSRKQYKSRWLLIDEIWNPIQAWQLRQLLRHGHRLIVASHVPQVLLRLVGVGYRGEFFRSDMPGDKLARYLANRQISYDELSLRRFIQHFGQSYNSLDVVLAYSKTPDLAVALDCFERNCRLSLSRACAVVK